MAPEETTAARMVEQQMEPLLAMSTPTRATEETVSPAPPSEVEEEQTRETFTEVQAAPGGGEISESCAVILFPEQYAFDF